jgi:NitT/TauT family transport system substrate-binding protein
VAALVAVIVALASVVACDGGPAALPSPGAARPNPERETTGAGPAASKPGGGAASQPGTAGTSAQAAPAPLSPPVTMKVGMLPAMANAVVYVGIERGYFREEGLEVEVVTLGSGSELLPAMAAGHLDAGTSSPGAGLFNAIGRDIPVRIVGDAGQYRPGYGFGAVAVRKDLIESGAVRDVPDLRGRSIAVTGRGVAMHMMAVRMLEAVGMSEADVNLQLMPFPEMLVALGNGQVDAAELTEPFVALGVERDILVRWKGHDELFPNQQQVVLTYSPPLLERSPEAANRFMVGWLRGVRDYIAAYGPEKRDQDAIIEIMFRHLGGQSADVYRKVTPVGYDPNGQVNVADLRAQQDWYHKAGLVREPVAIESVVDNRFAEYAVGRLGRQ